MAGEDEIAADIGEGLEDEAALGPAGMGDDEPAAADGLAVVVDQVDVDEAGGVLAEGAFAAEGGFDPLELGKELVGVEGGADDQDGVVEIDVGELLGDADGFGFVDGRGSEDGDFGQRGDGGARRLEAGELVIEVRTEAEAGFDPVHAEDPGLRPRTSRMP